MPYSDSLNGFSVARMRFSNDGYRTVRVRFVDKADSLSVTYEFQRFRDNE